MELIGEGNRKKYDFITYARQFDSYRWYKPILTMVLTLIFYLILFELLTNAVKVASVAAGMSPEIISEMTQGGYDNMNLNNMPGVLLNLGGVAVMLPALAIARLVVRERSFSSYTSSRGGWSNRVFFRCLLIALPVCGVPIVAHGLLSEDAGSFNTSFSAVVLIALIILTPLQCMAEEYIFRSLMTQALGSWIRVPIIAIVLSSVLFTLMHPYSRAGQLAVFSSGIVMGITAWLGRGLEVSGAFHVINNMTCFLLDFLGIMKIKAGVTMGDALVDICFGSVYVLVIFIISRKTDWFDRIKYDDAARYNEALAAKKAAKASRNS